MSTSTFCTGTQHAALPSALPWTHAHHCTPRRLPTANAYSYSSTMAAATGVANGLFCLHQPEQRRIPLVGTALAWMRALLPPAYGPTSSSTPPGALYATTSVLLERPHSHFVARPASRLDWHNTRTLRATTHAPPTCNSYHPTRSRELTAAGPQQPRCGSGCGTAPQLTSS